MKTDQRLNFPERITNTSCYVIVSFSGMFATKNCRLFHIASFSFWHYTSDGIEDGSQLHVLWILSQCFFFTDNFIGPRHQNYSLIIRAKEGFKYFWKIRGMFSSNATIITAVVITAHSARLVGHWSQLIITFGLKRGKRFICQSGQYELSAMHHALLRTRPKPVEFRSTSESFLQGDTIVHDPITNCTMQLDRLLDSWYLYKFEYQILKHTHNVGDTMTRSPTGSVGWKDHFTIEYEPEEFIPRIVFAVNELKLQILLIHIWKSSVRCCSNY